MGEMVWQQDEINEVVKNIKLRAVERSAQVMQNNHQFMKVEVWRLASVLLKVENMKK